MQELDRILSFGTQYHEFNDGIKLCTGNRITIDKKLKDLAEILYPHHLRQNTRNEKITLLFGCLH